MISGLLFIMFHLYRNGEIFDSENRSDQDSDSTVSQTKKLYVALYVSMSVTCLFIVLTNGIVMLGLCQALVQDIRKGFQPAVTKGGNSFITKILLTSMTSSCVFYGAYIIPIFITGSIVHGKLVISYSACAVGVYLDYMLCLVTNLHIVFLATDMYFLICKPLVYRLLTAKTGYALAVTAWTLPTLITILWIALQREQLDQCSENVHNFNNLDHATLFSFVYGILFFLTLLLVWIIYGVVLHFIYLFHKQAMKKPNQFGPPIVNTPDATFQHGHLETSGSQLRAKTFKDEVVLKSRLRSNVKSFRFIGLILLSYTAGWSPSWVAYLMYDTAGAVVPYWVNKLLSWCTHISYAINPILYCSNKSKVIVIQDTGKVIVIQDTGKVIVIQDTGKVIVIQDTGKVIVIQDTGKFIVIQDTGKVIVIQDTGKVIVIQDTGKVIVIQDTGKVIVIQDTGKVIVIQDTGKVIVIQDTGKVIVIQDTGKVIVIQDTGQVIVIQDTGQVIQDTGQVIVIQDTGQVIVIQDTGQVIVIQDTGQVIQDTGQVIVIQDTGQVIQDTGIVIVIKDTG
ncbi:Trace amine-associated receptor 1 [Biomphalaria glabrata]